MSARYRVLIAALLMLLIATLACAPATAEPKVFTSESGKFSIAFPGDPKEQTQSVPTAVGDVALTMYTVDNGDSAYLAGFADYPSDMVAASDPETMLDGGRDGAINNIDGTLLTEKHITISGNPGRELKVQSKDGKNVLYGRFYLVDARLYQIMVVTSPTGLDQATIDSFLDSFTLTD